MTDRPPYTKTKMNSIMYILTKRGLDALRKRERPPTHQPYLVTAVDVGIDTHGRERGVGQRHACTRTDIAKRAELATASYLVGWRRKPTISLLGGEVSLLVGSWVSK